MGGVGGGRERSQLISGNTLREWTVREGTGGQLSPAARNFYLVRLKDSYGPRRVSVSRSVEDGTVVSWKRAPK